jgi:bifunctional protein folD 1
MSRVLDCSTLEEEIFTKVKKGLKKNNLFLAIISFNNSKYCKLLINKCLELDIHFKHYKLDNPNTREVTSLIDELNKNDEITGILLVEPIPKNIDKYTCYEKIDINKDIDGVNHINQYYLSINKPKLINSTVLAVIKILEFYDLSLSGKNVTVIGRSYNISRPLVSYLINKNSTVTMCHSKTRDLVSILKNSDIVISVTGVNNLFKSSDLKEGSNVIDVGLGDVLIDSDNISYTPKTKGVGPLSIAFLLENVVTSCEKLK